MLDAGHVGTLVMSHPYSSGSPGVPESSMPTGASGLMPRRSSYASVVSGAAPALSHQFQQPIRSGAFSHLLNQPADFNYDSSFQDLTGPSRYDYRGYDMGLNTNGSYYGRSGSWARGGQLSGISSAFGSLATGPTYGVFGIGHTEHFFVPSYLKGSRYVQKLEEAHKAKVQAHREGPSAPASQQGSLSTSASSINLHSKMAPSHRGMTYEVIEKAPLIEDEELTPLPSRWNNQDKYGGLEVLSDGQEVKFTGVKSASDRDYEACAIRAEHAMPSRCGIYYFEVTIISRKREEYAISYVTIYLYYIWPSNKQPGALSALASRVKMCHCQDYRDGNPILGRTTEMTGILFAAKALARVTVRVSQLVTLSDVA